MPKENEPRVVVRMSESDHAVIAAAAKSVNVAVAGLMRECAVRYAASVAREVAAGSVSIRRQRLERAGSVPGVVRASSLSGPSSDAVERQARLNAMAARARGEKK